MSKILLASYRNPNQAKEFPEKAMHIDRRLSPDNITPNQLELLENGRTRIAIFSPVATLPVEKNSVCMGMMFPPTEKWWKPGEEAPDGSFGLFRTGENVVEILTDAVASRTVWYIQTDTVFIASTSQRAIICMLGDLEFNPEAVAWMLSSGSLGPGHSWDRRIKQLPPDSKLVFTPSSWELSISTEEAVFSLLQLPPEEHLANMENILAEVFSNLDLTKWVLTLSGGYDSRLILVNLVQYSNVRCVTWGLETSLDEPGNDAYVARQLADHYHLEHMYCRLEITKAETIDTILNRFLMLGEGRVDHLGGYLDGFKIWKDFNEGGIAGVLRGDQAIGVKSQVLSIQQIFHNVGIPRFLDYDNLSPALYKQLPHQNYPKRLHRKENETLATWRDRLIQQFRQPTILAALSDLKLGFVEVANPLLAKKVVEYARKLPDDLREDKIIVRRIVESNCPGIPIARSLATTKSAMVLRSAQFLNPILDELASVKNKGVIPDDLLVFSLKNISKKQNGSASIIKISKQIGNKLKRIKRGKKRQYLDSYRLAFRAFMICRMKQILQEDLTRI